MTQVKFGKFKPNRAGYAELMNQGGVQSLLESKAQAVKSSADAMVLPDKWSRPYNYEPHELKQIDGKLARGYVVRTKTDHARLANAKRNTLLKALGSAF